MGEKESSQMGRISGSPDLACKKLKLEHVSCNLLFDVSKVSDGVLHEDILYKFRHNGAAWKLLVCPRL